MEVFKELEQGSEEWLKARLGVPSSSRFSEMVSNGRGKDTMGATALSYAKELAIEKITGKPTSKFVSYDMERGTELEPVAMEYLLKKGLISDLELIGGILNHGCWTSTDGLEGFDAVIEIKCPKAETHFDYLLDEEKLIKKYYSQVQGEMWVSDRNKAYLFSFHPDFEDAQVFVEVDRDEEYIEKLEERAPLFIEQVEAYVDEFTNKYKKNG